MLREMKIEGFVMEPLTDTPIIVLKDRRNESSLHISIGLLEATAIATELEQIQFGRPMTHDLIVNLLTHLGVTVDRVEVHDLRENTFYAWIYLVVNGGEIRIDARPSDALAIALRVHARIYVNERLLQGSKRASLAGEAETQDEKSKKWTEILQNLSLEDFGKYKM